MKSRNILISKLLLIATLIITVFLFFTLDLQKYMSLENLKSSKIIYVSIYDTNPNLFLFIFFIIYTLITSFSLPGATILTLAGGTIFGFIKGTIVVSFASTIGATLAMLISRFLLKEWLQNRFSKQMKKINYGVEKDGGYYLFTLRLIPIMPFFAVNLGMGLTSIRMRTFFWVSQLGMLPATLLYVNAGSRLGDLRSIGDVLSPVFLGSFLALGFFPILAKKIFQSLKLLRV